MVEVNIGGEVDLWQAARTSKGITLKSTAARVLFGRLPRALLRAIYASMKARPSLGAEARMVTILQVRSYHPFCQVRRAAPRLLLDHTDSLNKDDAEEKRPGGGKERRENYSVPAKPAHNI